MKKDIIRLNDLTLKATHGCYQTEKLHPQTFVVTITCETTHTLDQGDELHRTINYENIRSIALRVFEQPPVNLIETLGNQIAEKVLSLDNVASVEVKIKKPEIWSDSTPELILYREK